MSALLLAGCAGSGTMATLEPRAISVDSTAEPASTVLSGRMAGLVSQTGPSYVTLIVHEAQKRGSIGASILPEALTSGSGFVVDAAGHVMTAGHVGVKVGNAVEARAASGRVYAGKVVAVLPSNDMALIKLTGFSGPAVVPASDHCMRAGDPVFSLGKPHAQGDTARLGELASMTFGRAVNYNGFGYPDAMVLRMSTKKGESGGPLFNSRGELTGMVVNTLSDGNGRPLNLAHAIPSPVLAGFLCQQAGCAGTWKTLATRPPGACPAS